MCKPRKESAASQTVTALAVLGALAAVTWGAYVALVTVGPFVALAAWLAGLGALAAVAGVARACLTERARQRAGWLRPVALTAAAAAREPASAYRLAGRAAAGTVELRPARLALSHGRAGMASAPASDRYPAVTIPSGDPAAHRPGVR